MMARALGYFATGLFLLFGVLPSTLWACAALWYDSPLPLLAAAYALVVPALLVFVRPFRRGVLAVLLLFAVVLVWWLSLKPSNDRDWLEDVSRLPRAHVAGKVLTIDNVRDFHYRGPGDTDYEARWETRRYDMDKIVGMDLFLSDWDAPPIVHTIMSWRFADGPPLAISVETRKEKGEVYSAIGGFFRQFELYYVVADERDVIGVRAAHRGEHVSLYPLRADPASARRLLDGYIAKINALNDKPRWYNAFTTNCTTVIFGIVREVFGVSVLGDWRIYANSHLPELLYEKGSINTSLPRDELVRLSNVTQRAIEADGKANFSEHIRVGLPPAPR
ncbi:DUF4105 domain-containing protein [Uliginosibacterium sp. H3]|uniref:DUF4105 domain-containing protein n=1 Tax=Uliginosibacterium silvisoli TaxID=3114758 RepID=A0ABU6K014_9RHOO|nr:DUF4105 domain-containing protein [Uliginosibacterium sp. H3]